MTVQDTLQKLDTQEGSGKLMAELYGEAGAPGIRSVTVRW